MTTSGDLLERLGTLEREVAELRRKLAPARGELPSSPFAALRVSVGDTWLLVPVEHVREVVRMAWLSPVPSAPAWMLGVLRFGERAVPVIDLGRKLLSRGTRPRADDFLVVLDTPIWCAFAVSGVGEVAWLDPSQIPTTEAPVSPWIIAALPDRDSGMVHLLSTATLVREVATVDA